MEGVNGRYCINPSPESPDANNKDIVYEVLWKRAGGGKYAEDIYVSAHVNDFLIACKSKDIITAFKKEILTRFVGTDEGEVTEYLGCDLIRDRSTKTPTIVQKGHTERVLKTFGMWDCKS